MLRPNRLGGPVLLRALAVAALLAAPPTGEASVSVQAGAPIELVLPEAPSGPLAVEVDGIDVTPFVRSEGPSLSVDPAPPVDPGWHRVDVYELDAEGGFWPRGSWDVEVRSAERLREFDGSGGISVEALHRLRDRDLADPYDRTTASGAARYDGRMADGAWSAQIRAPMLYDSEGDHGSLERRFDPTDYWLGAAFGPASMEIGHHMPEPASLVLQGFQRRGISAHLDTPLRTRVSTFVFRTDPITGFRESFGVSDEDRRTLGVTLATEPLPIRIGELEIAGTYLDATGDESGAAVGLRSGADAHEEGQAYAVSVDGHFLERRIRLRAEYARTHFDFDGGGRIRPVRDSGYAFLATLEPWPNAVLFGQPAQAVFSWEESEVGTFFRSLANAGAPTDLWTRRYRASLHWAGLSLDGSWSRNRDNRDDEDAQITYRQDDVLLQASYTPHGLAVADREDWTRFLGTPTVRATWWRLRTKPVANDGALVLYSDPLGLPCVDCREELVGYNRTLRLSEVGIGSRYGRFGWSASHARSRFDDAKALASDYTSKTTSADVDFRLTDRLSLDARFQREATRNRDPTFKTTRYLTGLGLAAVLSPDRLDTTVRVDWQEDRNSDRSQDQRRTVVTAYASWVALAASNHRPALAVSVLGTYEDVLDEHDSSRDLDAYQVYLKLGLYWSARHQGGRLLP